MSINSCTIDCSSIDAICNDRRPAILNTLFGNAIVISALAFPASVDAVNTVSGTVTFTNSGPGIANGNDYTVTLPQSLSPTFSNLPVGASASYNSLTGVVMFTGMPDTIIAGTIIGPIGISYEQPTGGSTVSASFTTTSDNSDPAAGYSTTDIAASGVIPNPSFGGRHPQHVNPTNIRNNLNIFRRDSDREEVVETHTLELPYISVTINFGGEEFTQTYERGDEQFRPMINVYGLSAKILTEAVIESVNITDLKIRIL